MTWEQSKQMDEERVGFVDRIMYDLGFIRHMTHPSYRGRYSFTDWILYRNDQTHDSVAVGFPKENQLGQGFEIATYAKFNNKITSAEWLSLYQFEEEIGCWIEECTQLGKTS